MTRIKNNQDRAEQLLGVINSIRQGSRIVYNDGREGHTDAMATVLLVDGSSMVVQFDDRADTTMIRFGDPAWMDHIRIAEVG